MKKRYTIEGMQPWAEPVETGRVMTPKSCPRCGSGVGHDVEGVTLAAGTFQQDGPTMVRCLNDACGWTGTYARPR